MGALITSLVPVLALAFGVSAGTILSGLTVAQWAAIAAAVVNLGVTEAPLIKSQLAALHPLFDKLIADAEQFGVHVAAHNAVASAANIPSDPDTSNPWT